MAPWLISALISGGTAVVGSALTRRDNKKEAARVEAANKAEAARVQKENKAEAARVEALRKQEQTEAIADNTKVRENYYKNVVLDAQAAGINPLTALRTGAGSAYGSTVQGTIRQPVMRDGVYLEGVYQTPTLSRNPLDVGLQVGTQQGLAEFTRGKQETHDVKMAELRGAIDRANSLAIQKGTRSPDGKLPPPDQWWRYLRNPDGSLALDADGYAQIREGRKSIPLTTFYRIPGVNGDTSFLSLNMESFESGPGEIIASSSVHAGAAGTAEVKRFFDTYRGGEPLTRSNKPKTDWRSNVSYGLQQRFDESMEWIRNYLK